MIIFLRNFNESLCLHWKALCLQGGHRCEGMLLFFRNFLLSKILMVEREVSRFRWKFFLTWPQNFIGESFFIQKFSCNEFLMHTRRAIVVSAKVFLTIWKNFKVEPICILGKLWYQKIPCIGRGHHGFVDFFCLTGEKRKTSLGALLFFRKSLET